MSCSVAVYIHCARQPGYVSRHGFDINGKCSCKTAKPLRSYSEAVYPFEKFLLKAAVERVRVSLVDVSHEGFFGNQRSLVKRTSYTNAYDYWRAWVLFCLLMFYMVLLSFWLFLFIVL